MITEHKIKDGLLYKLQTIFTKCNNNSFLKRQADSISLYCLFSGPVCSLSSNDSPISYGIEFIFQNYYLKYFSCEEENLNVSQFAEHQQHDICCNTQMILHDIINTKLKGAFRNMFLESKALSLLLCFQKCNTANQTTCESCKFLANPIEKEKFLKAKEILLRRLNNAPTIQELSVAIGINQCYLKKGFKELFGTTIYDFVQEKRMIKAKLLLTTSELSVSQVADEIGFSSASNFSSAFKKFTGIFPSEFQQN